MQPDGPSSCIDPGWEWPGVAQYLSLLAPQLAPRDPANVYPSAPKYGPMSGGASASAGQLRHGTRPRTEISETKTEPRLARWSRRGPVGRLWLDD